LIALPRQSHSIIKSDKQYKRYYSNVNFSIPAAQDCLPNIENVLGKVNKRGKKGTRAQRRRGGGRNGITAL